MVPRIRSCSAETDSQQVDSSLVANPRKKARTSSDIDEFVSNGELFDNASPLPRILTYDPYKPNETIDNARLQDFVWDFSSRQGPLTKLPLPSKEDVVSNIRACHAVGAAFPVVHDSRTDVFKAAATVSYRTTPVDEATLTSIDGAWERAFSKSVGGTLIAHFIMGLDTSPLPPRTVSTQHIVKTHLGEQVNLVGLSVRKMRPGEAKSGDAVNNGVVKAHNDATTTSSFLLSISESEIFSLVFQEKKSNVRACVCCMCVLHVCVCAYLSTLSTNPH